MDRTNFEILANALDVREPNLKKQVTQWHSQLIIRDFWHQNLKALKEDNTIASNAQLQALKTCLAEFEVTEEYKSVINDISVVYQWLFGPNKKVEDLLKPGQKITSEDQEAKLMGQLNKIKDNESAKVKAILESRGVFSDSPESVYVKNFLSFNLLAVSESGNLPRFLSQLATNYSKSDIEALLTTYT
jgi:hypothetical protein